MIETCVDCDRTWGVTMEPREHVKCTDCSRSQPWRNPAYYWWCRVYAHAWPHAWYRSPEWWDQQCALEDLKYAAELAENLGADRTSARADEPAAA